MVTPSRFASPNPFTCWPPCAAMFTWRASVWRVTFRTRTSGATARRNRCCATNSRSGVVKSQLRLDSLCVGVLPLGNK